MYLGTSIFSVLFLIEYFTHFIVICQRNPFISPNCTFVCMEQFGQKRTTILASADADAAGTSAVPSPKCMVALFESRLATNA